MYSSLEKKHEIIVNAQITKYQHYLFYHVITNCLNMTLHFNCHPIYQIGLHSGIDTGFKTTYKFVMRSTQGTAYRSL